MTLGGMALAVGILVDDATVEIENIHRNMAQRKPLVRAILDGAQQIAVPAFVSTLCICIVFVPVVFITGAAKSLFVPLALAVVFAMLTSYLLSRTLVPTMVRYLLEKEAERSTPRGITAPPGSARRFFAAFERGFERLRTAYGRWLAWALRAPRGVRDRRSSASSWRASLALLPLVGRDFFPSVDAGPDQAARARRRRARASRRPSGASREIEDTIRTRDPARARSRRCSTTSACPYSGINLSLSEGALISPADGEILIALKEDHAPDRRLRAQAAHEAAPATIPDTTFFFLAPDISTQVLNFGLPAPIDVQVVGAPGNEDDDATRSRSEIAGRDAARSRARSTCTSRRCRASPQLRVDVDRTMAAQAGLTQRDVASDLLVSLSSSAQVAPSYWLDPKRGVQYLVAVQTPQYQIDSFDARRAHADLDAERRRPAAARPTWRRSRAPAAPANVTHYNVAAHLRRAGQRRRHRPRLGRRRASTKIVDRDASRRCRAAPRVAIRGQVESMESSFRGPRLRARLRGRCSSTC